MSTQPQWVEDRRAMCAMPCTLDGHPARIQGVMGDFAHVRRTDGRGGLVEFAWETVAHVLLHRDGRFES